MNNLEIIQMTHEAIVQEDRYAFMQDLTTEQIANAYSREKYHMIGTVVAKDSGLYIATNTTVVDEDLWQRAYCTPTQASVQQELYFGPVVGWINFRLTALSDHVGLYRYNPRAAAADMRCPAPYSGKG